MKRQTIKKLLISPIFPTLLIPIFMAVVYLINLINPLNPIPPIIIPIILLMLVFWAIVRWWLEQTLPLIKQYYLLMKLLEELNSCGGQIFLEVIDIVEYPPNNISSSDCGVKNIKLKQREVDMDFGKLNIKLVQLINFPYRLLWTDMDSLEREFVKLVKDTKILYENFNIMMHCKNIPEFRFNFPLLNTRYKDFISALNRARNRFIEIESAVPASLLYSPSFSTEYITWKV